MHRCIGQVACPPQTRVGQSDLIATTDSRGFRQGKVLSHPAAVAVTGHAEVLSRVLMRLGCCAARFDEATVPSNPDALSPAPSQQGLDSFQSASTYSTGSRTSARCPGTRQPVSRSTRQPALVAARRSAWGIGGVAWREDQSRHGGRFLASYTAAKRRRSSMHWCVHWINSAHSLGPSHHHSNSNWPGTWTP